MAIISTFSRIYTYDFNKRKTQQILKIDRDDLNYDYLVLTVSGDGKIAYPWYDRIAVVDLKNNKTLGLFGRYPEPSKVQAARIK